MINNRQNGRRRGRGGGQRPPSQGGNVGNRQDNRSRGNAAQLLEKYKSLARDAQMQGDRVQSEYWLQFADHYYRVLNENRARFEEQRRPRDDYYSDEDEDQDDGVSAEGDGDDGEEMDDRGGRQERDRQDRSDRQERGERQDRPERQERDRQDRGERRDRFEARERPRREPRESREPREGREERGGEGRERFRPRREREEQPEAAPAQAEERISLDVLPPAIAIVDGDAPAKAPRRRTRRPRADDAGEAEIAPAA